MEGSFLNKFSPSSPKKNCNFFVFSFNRIPGFFPTESRNHPREKPHQILHPPSPLCTLARISASKVLFSIDTFKSCFTKTSVRSFFFCGTERNGTGREPSLIVGRMWCFLVGVDLLKSEMATKGCTPKNCGNFGWVLVKSKV